MYYILLLYLLLCIIFIYVHLCSVLPSIFGGVAIYVHNSFSFNRLDTVIFKQNSTVYEACI